MADLSALADAIAKTLSPDLSQRRSAEAFLEGKSTSPRFSVSLLQLIALETAPQHVRQATAVYMKNHTIKTYANPDWLEQPADDRNAVKAAIVDVMLCAPTVVRRQLSEVLAIVAEHEYPKHWPALVPELSAKLTGILQATASLQPGQELVASVDWVKLQGILETLHAIFDRYPERMRNDELYTEINYSLEHTQEHVKALFAVFTKIVEGSIDTKDPNVITMVFANIDLLCKIFYCLSWQEIPAYFEDHLQEYMTEIRKLLVYESAVIDGMDEDEPSCLDAVHASILEITNLYATKFDEEFRPFLPQFLGDAWGLLVRRSSSPKYDGVVTTGIKFLTSVSRGPDNHLFKDPATLAEVCNRIVIPNIELREGDVELFEDNPVEYIRRDMEGSDTGTRRRGAVELVKGLCTHFEKPVTELFSSYVTEMLSAQADWRKRDTALYIVTALGWKSGTMAGGATETSSLINVVEFFGNFVMPELDKSAANPTALTAPIFTADLVKFVISFRNQIPKEGCANVIMLCGKFLGAKEPVLRTYAAACIERILTVKDKVVHANGNGVANGGTGAVDTMLRISKSDLEPTLPNFLPTVLKALKESARADEYLMRLVLRFCTVARDAMAPYVEALLSVLVEVFVAVTANPANPLFNHYLCEAISALIRFNANGNTIAVFENALHTPMCNVLVNDVTEFAPYVFQIMSQLMMVHHDPLPPTYGSLMQPILNPSMWERRGYIPGMVQYIEAFVAKSKSTVLSGSQLEQILGVFQKLLASKATDHHGLRLLTTIFEVFDRNELGERTNAIFSVLLLRLSKAKTVKFVANLLCCLSTFALRFGAESMRASFDEVQPNVFEVLLRQVWLPDVVTLTNADQRRLCAIALTEIACGSDLCVNSPYFELWPQLVNANVALTEGLVVDQEQRDGGDTEEEEAPHLGAGESYSAAHSQLRWGSQSGGRVSPLVAGKDARRVLTSKVSEFMARHASRFNPVFQQRVDAGAREAIMKYAAPPQPSG